MDTHAAKPQTSPAAEIPIFRTEQNRTRLMSIYQEKLSRWPVPCETFFVPTRYGKTHVIASGDPASPVVVLLHPGAVSALAEEADVPPTGRRSGRLAFRTSAPVSRGT